MHKISTVKVSVATPSFKYIKIDFKKKYFSNFKVRSDEKKKLNEKKVEKTFWQNPISWTLNRTSDTLETTTSIVKYGIDSTGDVGVKSLQSVSQIAKDLIPKGEKEMKVHPYVKSSVGASSKLADMSSKTVNSGINAVTNIGSYGGKVVGDFVGDAVGMRKKKDDDYEESDTMEALKRFSKTTIGSGLGILDSIEKVVKNVVDETQKSAKDIVQHRYGDEAANTVDETVNAYKNISKTIYKTKSIGVKKLAKTAAKNAGKETLKAVIKKEDDKIDMNIQISSTETDEKLGEIDIKIRDNKIQKIDVDLEDKDQSLSLVPDDFERMEITSYEEIQKFNKKH